MTVCTYDKIMKSDSAQSAHDTIRTTVVIRYVALVLTTVVLTVVALVFHVLLPSQLLHPHDDAVGCLRIGFCKFPVARLN